MFSVVVAPKALTVVAVVFTNAKVVDAVVIEVVIAGEVPNTRTPVPVSSVTAEIRLALDGVARNVATPVPSPEIPVETGSPVQLVNVPLAGVPNAGVVNDGLSSHATVLFVLAISGMVNVAAPVV